MPQLVRILDGILVRSFRCRSRLLAEQELLAAERKECYRPEGHDQSVPMNSTPLLDGVRDNSDNKIARTYNCQSRFELHHDEWHDSEVECDLRGDDRCHVVERLPRAIQEEGSNAFADAATQRLREATNQERHIVVDIDAVPSAE